MIFRGEIVKNVEKKADAHPIEDNTISEFKEEIDFNSDDDDEDDEEDLEKENNEIEDNNKNIFTKRLSNIVVTNEDENENNENGLIKISSKLIIKNNYKWKKKTHLHKHQLILCETERFLGCQYYCNRCRETFNRNIPSYYCTLCDFDICKNCINESEFLSDSKEMTQYNEGNYWQFKFKNHIHPLSYLKIIKKKK